MTALDFSYARPGSAALNAAGVTTVGRYLATDGRGITPAEFDDYISHGISVWFIKENAARGMLNGYGQGVADAQWAENQMNALGVSGAPIYFTADFDVQSSQFPACDAYLNGAASVIGLARVGIYAGLHYLNHAVNLANYYWKTAANSWDHGETAAIQLHLIQTLDAVPIPGTDFNVVVQENHGQVSVGGNNIPTGGGNHGNIVAIQTALNLHGYTLTVDGILGPLTNAAIRDYQSKNGLVVDGIVGPLTWASLNGTALLSSTTAPPYPLPAGSYFGPATGPVTSVSGYYGHQADLQVWQQRMANRGWTIATDGHYGPQTAGIARAFQTEKGLTVDSLIGPQTWAAAWTAPIT